MKRKLIIVMIYVWVLQALLTPVAAKAESGLVTGRGAVQAKVSFRIIIQHSLYLQVQSTGQNSAGESTLNKVTVDPAIQAAITNMPNAQDYYDVLKSGKLKISSSAKGIYSYSISQNMYPADVFPFKSHTVILFSP